MNRRKQARKRLDELREECQKSWMKELAELEANELARRANREAWALACKYLLLQVRHRARLARRRRLACAAKNRLQARSRLLASPRDRREDSGHRP